jgi:ATP-dependent RNA helicase RhlE
MLAELVEAKKVKPKTEDRPEMTFEDFDLDERILRAVKEKGYVTPTPIQEKTIPLVLEGRDVMGAAQTGTGKTAAFGLPLLHHLLQGKKTQIRVLILSPTRELTAQTEENLKEYAKYTKLRILPIFGGVAYGPQLDGLRRGVDILVATPGRLMDHMSKGTVDFSHLQTVVLDEADRMMDMGFLPDLKKIFRELPSVRQTMLYSATFPDQIMKLANQILKDPIHIQVGDKSSSPSAITHTVYPVPAHLKPGLLKALLKHEGVLPALIFTRTKHRADRLQKVLERAGFKIAALHSNRTQKQRVEALEGFKKGKFDILVATDIAARGIDVRGISHVINYDLPATPEDYIHRTGRTARADEIGDAATLMAPAEEILLHEIERHMNRSLAREALRDFDYSSPPPEKENSLQKVSGQVGPAKTSFHSSHRARVPRRKF